MKYSLFVLFIAVVAVLAIFRKTDGFGATSPGTMVQLSTSHVTTEDDLYYYKYIYPKIVRKEIYNMTESDRAFL